MDAITPSNASAYMFQWPFGAAGFEEIVRSPEVFATHLNASLASNLNHRLASMGIGNSSTMLVQAVELNASKGAYTVVFSPEGQRLLSLGKATLMGNGQRPILVDVQGRIVEMGRISQHSVRVVAALATVAVAAAHIIATGDLVQRIEQIRQGVNWLIMMRQIDQWAKVERIFYAARELCARPIDQTARMELWRMRQELRELRAVLRREWQAKLEQIKVEPLWVDQLPPDLVEWVLQNLLIPQQYKEALRNGGKLPPDVIEWFLRNPLIRMIYDNALAQEQKKATQAFDQTLVYPLLIELGWRLEHVLAIASQTEQEFWKSISNEVDEVAKIVQAIAEKGQRVKLQYWLVKPYTELVERYRQLSTLSALSA
ncbi:hypothetical protein A6A03_17435 [Chloroflexus islandicus]|uniref:Uncharacterized protein n=1 Tax=Chloroflexus islandicus TaxID=1707952 RepID=A0A178M677_9CHLR|nr:hypothetical protein [Chloroflexus islandicus]OAN44259.1 hypothetical protein A6A03_17435 [Chloroflexus islandicus]